MFRERRHLLYLQNGRMILLDCSRGLGGGAPCRGAGEVVARRWPASGTLKSRPLSTAPPEHWKARHIERETIDRDQFGGLQHQVW